MKYILIALLALSLPAMAMAAKKQETPSDTKSDVLQKLQKHSTEKCDPQKELYMPHFN